MTARVLLLAGEAAERSAPMVSLARALDERGVRATLFDDASSVSDWVATVRRHDVLVFTHYGAAHLFLHRQLHLAALAGCAVLRWWVGTDVLLARENPQAARALDAAVDLNVAVAPHLVAELAEIGMAARCVPSVCHLPSDPPPAEVPRGVLAYLPTLRREFYGADAVARAATDNPDLPFIVVGDEGHALAHLPNVDSLGWVDMEAVWPRVGCVLRMTEHDGLPRLILEALARGRYAIYRWPLEGCWQAETAAEVQRGLDRFRRVTGANVAGRASALGIAKDAPVQWQAVVSGPYRPRRLPALLRLARCQIAFKRTAAAS